MSTPQASASEIRISGTVQGVGFRPTVWRLAREEGLLGEVLNDGKGVLIRTVGSAEARHHVVAFDFGMKANILRMLTDRGCRVTVVPATTPASAALALEPDGIFLSNGPGDPEPCTYAVAAIREFIGRRIPVFGICLGHQLLGLAAGARTVKMNFGHHGANHPVQDLATGQVMITSQNHGFAVDESTLPARARPTHRPLFDHSLQGIELNLV